jgi:DNA repair protein RadA/Sms
VPANTVVFGEVGLSGEVRPVSQSDVRLREAAKLGFEAAIVPRQRGRQKQGLKPVLRLSEIAHLTEMIPLLKPGAGTRGLTGGA